LIKRYDRFNANSASEKRKDITTSPHHCQTLKPSQNRM
jgi:hypothetical protein